MGAPLVGGASGSKLRTQNGKSLTELLYPFETVTRRMYLHPVPHQHMPISALRHLAIDNCIMTCSLTLGHMDSDWVLIMLLRRRL